MKDALLAEYRKLVSTRMWWLMALIMVTYLGFIGVVMAFSLTATPPAGAGGPTGMPEIGGVQAAVSVYGLVNAIGYVFPLLIGSLAMTTEFRHQTITQSLLVEPRRTVFLLAKLLATVPIGLVYGVLGVGALVAGAAPILAWLGDGAFLTDGQVLETLGLGVLVVVLWAVIGVTVGTMLPHQVAAIVVILAMTQFVEPIARVALGSFEATTGVAKYLPGAAADAILGSGFLTEMSGAGADTLSRPVGALVLVAYAVAFAVIGRLTTLRRDVG
jgi:hypothetical protein